LLNRHQLFGFCRELRQHLHCPRMSVKKEFWLKKTDGDNVRLPLQSSSAVECSEVGAREISQQLKKQLNKIQAKKGPTGFEPVTSWSAVKCSTTELWTPCCRYCLTNIIVTFKHNTCPHIIKFDGNKGAARVWDRPAIRTMPGTIPN
jgi:hypothetical protein